jgi:hypothetical protein
MASGFSVVFAVSKKVVLMDRLVLSPLKKNNHALNTKAPFIDFSEKEL